ncbi:MAG: NADP-dependent malic enzyme [Deltaproteobacteria bacterium]|nr:NADP-dependent malic enzyme [Deltaproteobacteria bacterium]
MIRKQDSLTYHGSDRPGKIEVRATKPCLTPREMRLAYLPGATFPSKAIADDISQAFQYTSRGNLVGIITNGSAVPGLGDVGPVAAKPFQEGIAILFKRLADIDVFDLELNTTDPDRFIDTVLTLEPTFGGINLSGLCAPEGLRIYDQLVERLHIPVFHENLYSSAVVAAAALLNALDLVEKRIEDIRVVISGIGTVGTGCARLFLKLGVRPEHLLVYDKKGLLHPNRNDLHDYQRVFARKDPALDLTMGIKGADVFLGASGGGVITQEMVRSMNAFPVVLALSTPEPEIGYETARAARRDIIVATSLSQHPNAILDMLSFPYIFRGALDVQANGITEGMLLAAAHALAELAREEVVEEVEKAYSNERFSFGPEYLLPKPIDPRILVNESAAVARQAILEGVAGLAIEDETYRERLTIRLGTGRETMRGLIMKARHEDFRVVFSEGSSETILRACAILVDENIAQPILVGNEQDVRKIAERLDLDLGGVQIIDPFQSPRFEAYVEEYFRMRQRRGVMRAEAVKRLRKRDYFAALMVHTGDADMLFAGVSTHYVESLRTILEVIGPAPGIQRVSSHHMILLPKDVYFLADCAVNIDPTAEDLAEIALLTAGAVRSLGIEPRVAMLSFSTYGSVNHPLARKIRQATDIARSQDPELMIDGEIQLAIAVNSTLRRQYFPFCELEGNANVLIFPDLQSGNLALNLIQHMSDAASVGPVLAGTRLPAHPRQYGATVEEVVNLTTLGVVEAAAIRGCD